MYFPLLPVLEKLKELPISGFDANQTFLISVQHLVETTGSLFQSLLDIGFLPDHIYLKGKIYSTNPVVESNLIAMGINVFIPGPTEKYGQIREVHKKDIARMWDAVEPRLNPGTVIIVLDDGGLVIRQIPTKLLGICRFYGIEQTTSGLRWQHNGPSVPIIQVAASAAKMFLEPPLISRALHRKLQSYFKLHRPRLIGIVGYGNIGKAMAEFLNKVYPIMVYDVKPEQLQGVKKPIMVARDVSELIINCDFIIGATGIDFGVNLDWEPLVHEPKTVISVSSNDTEFHTLLRSQNHPEPPKRVNPLADIKISYGKHRVVTLVRGGTVANFDNTRESVRQNQIQLTRGLLFCGVVQALDLAKPKAPQVHGPVKLSAVYQKAVVSTWFKYNTHYQKLYPAELVKNFNDTAWIESQSREFSV